MEHEPIISREEVTATIFVLTDISATLVDILELLRDVYGEEQEDGS
jgi:hypothetical protein